MFGGYNMLSESRMASATSISQLISVTCDSHVICDFKQN